MSQSIFTEDLVSEDSFINHKTGQLQSNHVHLTFSTPLYAKSEYKRTFIYKVGIEVKLLRSLIR